MRSKRKKIVYMMFLLITLLMFLHSWKLYVTPIGGDSYAKKHLSLHAAQTVGHPIHQMAPVVVHA